MAIFKVFHKGSHYKFSAVPVNYRHLLKVLGKIPDCACAELFYYNEKKEFFTVNNEETFKSVLSQDAEEIILYTELPSSDEFEYIDLQKSLVLDPTQVLTELIRQELGLDSKLVHEGYQCSRCSVQPIKGFRYFCQVCKTNFCEICEDIENIQIHPLLKIKTNEEKLEIKPKEIYQKVIEKGKLAEKNLFKPEKPDSRPQIEQRFGKIVFQSVLALKECGFTDESKNKKALEMCNYDVPSAINYLLSQE